jgi:hypothetical protein
MMKEVFTNYGIDHTNLTRMIQTPDLCMPGSKVIENTIRVLKKSLKEVEEA